ncbi:hypothetical protein E2C01_069132 [Portunus trituberculatus]|uniref:CCHC-type domain-containing protein n=1 Tax=Portunus trituberculatus TaxID=210409 RepID=A0A5B7HZS8_PORTR|nr:hypothetical protein [Portunus trituberculatus]
MLSSANFKRLMSDLLFVVQLDSPTFAIASDIEFTEKDFLYDVCKNISEKSPPAPQSVSVVQTPPPPTPVQPLTRNHSPSRGRSSSRPSHHTQYRHRSHSRSSRNVICHRCGIRGHVVQSCHVVLDDQGRSQFNPNAFCSLHNKRGHSLAECRLYQLQCSSQPSGNAERQSLTPQS